jgi:putative membrane protein
MPLLEGWKPDWLMVATLTATGVWYAVGLARSAKRGALIGATRAWEAGAFAVGWLTLVAALLSPIATASEILFSVHMTQHELLMLVAAPLLMLGRPIVPFLWALPLRWRRTLTAQRHATGFWRRVTSPASVFAIHAFALWIWHLPALYQAAVLDDRIHALQHLSFTGSACLFWWGLLRGRYGRLGYGAAVFYVFATAVHSGGLGALMTLARSPWYPLYVERAGQAIDPLEDQQLAGLIMWIPSGVVLTLFGLAIFAAWLGEAERRRRLAG